MMMEDSDPLGIRAYMQMRMQELFGPDFFGHSRGGLEHMPRSLLGESESPAFYINPDVEFAFPDVEVVATKGPSPSGEDKARGYRHYPGGVEILESPNARPSRPPRRLFRVDVTESADAYLLRADLAGMIKSNVKVNVSEEQHLVNISVDPPKDEFFGMYKSPLESKAAWSSVEEGHGKEKVYEGQRPEEAEETTETKETKETKEAMETGERTPTPSDTPKSHALAEKEVCHLHERCTNNMTRSIKMPQAVDMAKVEASMRDGLLVMKFAKRERELESGSRHEVEIK